MTSIYALADPLYGIFYVGETTKTISRRYQAHLGEARKELAFMRQYKKGRNWPLAYWRNGKNKNRWFTCVLLMGRLPEAIPLYAEGIKGLIPLGEQEWIQLFTNRGYPLTNSKLGGGSSMPVGNWKPVYQEEFKNRQFENIAIPKTTRGYQNKIVKMNAPYFNYPATHEIELFYLEKHQSVKHRLIFEDSYYGKRLQIMATFMS